MKKFWIIPFFTLLFSSLSFGQEIKRFALAVGVNDGGEKRVKLRYAVSDAKSIAKVFQELGGVSAKDITLLEQPNASQLSSEIKKISDKIAKAKKRFARIEMIFYYSGHSDEQGLLLGSEKFNYKELREMIQKVPADIKISILDSCASGAITRLKGGKKQSPFLFDSSLKMKGYAFITSSSHDEASQESDKIRGSYFTHYFISGLRGAADMSQKGRVTLNESYQFAFYETLAQTEKSLNGVQHPGYEIKMVGSGDVVMTDLKQASVILNFAEDLEGRISLRDLNGNFVAELQKSRGKAIQIGLDAGVYEAVISFQNKVYAAKVNLKEEKKTLAMQDFKPIFIADPALKKGGEETYENVPFSFALLPSISTGYVENKKVIHNISVHLLADYSDKLEGIGFGGVNIVGEDFRGGLEGIIGNIVYGEGKGFESASFFNINSGNFQGLQLSAIFNKNGKNSDGAQICGIINLNAGNFAGWQLAVINQSNNMDGVQTGVLNIASETKGTQIGVVNISDSKVHGLMLGVVNIADDADVPIGIINIIKNGRLDWAIWMDENQFYMTGVKMGTKHFYSMPFFGMADNNAKTFGIAVGGHFSIFDLIFIEPEIFYQSFYQLGSQADKMGYQHDKIEKDWGNWTAFRLTVGTQFKSFGVFAGAALPLFYTNHFQWFDNVRNFEWSFKNFKDWAQFYAGIQYSFF